MVASLCGICCPDDTTLSCNSCGAITTIAAVFKRAVDLQCFNLGQCFQPIKRLAEWFPLGEAAMLIKAAAYPWSWPGQLLHNCLVCNNSLQIRRTCPIWYWSPPLNQIQPDPGRICF